jgi:pSer/pThr/pTyr-binding forkhead associated (FHA) protein
VRVDDPERTISKTHLLARLEGSVVVVEDRHSTNGTVLESARGSRSPLVPGQAEEAALGAALHLGSVRIEVVAGG